MVERLLTITDVADILKMSRSGVWYKIKRQELAAFKVGRDFRVSEDSLLNYIAECNKKEEIK